LLQILYCFFLVVSELLQTLLNIKGFVFFLSLMYVAKKRDGEQEGV
jgi:hypothetical protein